VKQKKKKKKINEEEKFTIAKIKPHKKRLITSSSINNRGKLNNGRKKRLGVKAK
jgi:hypothetical protein